MTPIDTSDFSVADLESSIADKANQQLYHSSPPAISQPAQGAMCRTTTATWENEAMRLKRENLIRTFRKEIFLGPIGDQIRRRHKLLEILLARGLAAERLRVIMELQRAEELIHQYCIDEASRDTALTLREKPESTSIETHGPSKDTVRSYKGQQFFEECIGDPGKKKQGKK